MGLKPRVQWASGHCLRAQLETRETGAADREEKSTGPRPKTANTESGFRTEMAAQRKPRSRGFLTGWKSPTAHEQKLTRKIKRSNRALNLENQVGGQKALQMNFLAVADTNRSMRDSRDGKTWRKISNLRHVIGKQIRRGNKTYEPQIQRERNGDTTK
jgi:hypothetical protein